MSAQHERRSSVGLNLRPHIQGVVGQQPGGMSRWLSGASPVAGIISSRLPRNSQ
jgi:hypothetical protein